MLFFNLVNGVVVSVSEEDGQACRWDMKTFADAERFAAQANALNDGETYLATDSGPSVSPRYDVVRKPKVGQPVSYSFNGDSYPCGVIVSVGDGPKARVVTDDGSVFYRRKLSGSWRKQGGTWSLIQGHHNERNPSF